MSTKKATRIVILGAGFGGISAALEFAKHQEEENLEVTLVDRNNYQLFTPILYEIASAAQEIENEQHLKETVCLDVHVALGQYGIRFLQANVQDVQSQKKQVVTDKETLEYDYLLVALGSEPFYFGIEGMQEHALPFKWVNDATAIRNAVKEGLEKNEKTHVLICGGGPAGVELATELMSACKAEVVKNCFSTTIVEAQEHILGSMGKRTQHAAEHALTHQGVNTETQFLITKAEEKNGKKVLTSKDGKIVEGDILVWTGGVTANSLLKKTDLALTERGQIAVHKTLQSKDDEHVFAVGDVVECEVVPNEYSMQTAHEAVLQGPLAAKNILAHMQGKNMRNHKKAYAGLIITTGGKRGIVELPGGFVMSGFIGWVLRKAVDFKHFRSVLPFMQACSIWYQGMKTMTKND